MDGSRCSWPGVPFKCPAAPFEAALLIADQLGDPHTSGQVRVDAYTPDPLPMPVAGPEVGKALVRLLQGKHVGFHGEKAVTGVDVARRALTFSDGTSAFFDLLAVVPPHAPTAAAKSTGLGPASWIPVDPHTLATNADGVWAPRRRHRTDARQRQAAAQGGRVRRSRGRRGRPRRRPIPRLRGARTRLHRRRRLLRRVGAKQAAKGEGNFFTAPAPAITLHEPSSAYRQEKDAQETAWLTRWNHRPSQSPM